MIEAFKQRKPIPAAILGLWPGPFIGMLYLKKGKIALIYLAITILVAVIWSATKLGLLKNSLISGAEFSLYLIQIAGALHCYYTAKNSSLSPTPKWYSRWYALVIFTVLPIILAVIFRLFYYEPLYSASNSMSPNIPANYYFFAEKFSYNDHLPQRGDIIVFKTKFGSHVKRIIGMPKDKVQLKNGIIYLNDVAVKRQQLENHGQSLQFLETLPEGTSYKILSNNEHSDLANTDVYIVPEDNFFALGDNRDKSIDSRNINTIGYVAKNDIIGKAVFIFGDTKEKNIIDKNL